MSRRILLTIGIVIFTLLPLQRAQADVANPAADEAAYIASLNQARAAAGLPPLKVDGQLSYLARVHSQKMADAGQIFHSSPLSTGVTSAWTKLGENVGTGPTVSSIMNAFVNSPSHYANIIDRSFTHVGVGVVYAGNVMYTTHRFMAVESAPTLVPTTAPPAPPPTRAPADPPPAPTTTVPPPPPPPAATPERVTAVLTALRSIV